MPLATLEKAQQLLPQVRFAQAYGMTELSPIATTSPHENHVGERAARGLIKSAGRAASLQQVRIVDESDRELPRGEVGEIAVQGPNVMQGYFNKPEATAEALRAGYKCPRSIELVDALPLSGAGKVQKNELRKSHWGGAGQGRRLSREPA